MNDTERAADKHIAAFNAHDPGALARNETPDIEFEAPGVKLRGREQVADFFGAYWRAFPDALVTLRSRMIDGETVVSENVLTGTHTGPLFTPGGDIPPTGRRIETHGVAVQRVSAGLVASEHLYFDQVELLTQLGMLPKSTEAVGS
jgi:steroid delta-isomerase-like uncharacterized protein